MARLAVAYRLVTALADRNATLPRSPGRSEARSPRIARSRAHLRRQRPKFAVLEEQPLDPERYDRAGFHCGVPELDHYLHRLAIVDAKNPAAKAFYEHYGFTTCVDASTTLYLPLG